MVTMEGGIDPSAPLDYVEFQMFPTQNRYEAHVQSNNNVEIIASGPLEQLLLHSPKVKELCSRGSNAKFRIQPPDSQSGAEWFTTSTLTRFLHIIGSPNILNITNEISQLEETRNFQASLSAKTGRASRDGSKNELLRAMDLRLTILKEEFAAAFNQATDAICSPEDIYKLENFSHLFGAEDIRNSFCEFVALKPEEPTVNVPSERNILLTNDTPVKYGASPAKVAEIERQSSTGTEESSLSSEEDQLSVGRSRTLLRPASPRRSASPMRRVQIGRSGSRRATSISIKSLSFYPARERVVSHRDVTAGNSSEDEGIDNPPKNNVVRMSVQDKISLFESKQKGQTADDLMTNTSVNATIVPKKAVLRRWSSGMGEYSVQGLPDIVSESSDSVPATNVDDPKSVLKVNPPESVEIHVKSVLPEQRVDICEVDDKECAEVNSASAEWSRQKEAELNQLFMKMKETKPVRQRNDCGINSKTKKFPSEVRGGYYDHYKQKRDEKLRGEAAGKRAEKEAQFKVMEQFLDEKKAEIASTNIGEVGRKNLVKKTQKLVKPSQSLSSKKEISKPVPKKSTSKTTPQPVTRKSWPLTPSPRTTGASPKITAASPKITAASPAKTPNGNGPTSAGTTPVRRKPQPASSIPRSSPNVEKPQPRPKILKETRDDLNKSVEGTNEKKRQIIAKKGKTTKTNAQITPEDLSLNAKPSFYNKVTKKGTVVPLESKPFLRKGAGVGPGVGPAVVKTKASPQPEESLRNCETLVLAEENNVMIRFSDLIIENQEIEPEVPENCRDLESETQIAVTDKCENTESPDQDTTSVDDCVKHIELSPVNTLKLNEEELEISPSAWVEIDEDQDEIVPSRDSPIQIAASANVRQVGTIISSSRVRHSLSQMLLEESSEADSCEWGNAENPTSMVYQKDAPKGLKRLLKFARKSKADSHLTDLSSPLVFSEGEDEIEETRSSRRDSDHSLRKAVLHASSYDQLKVVSNEAYMKNSDKSHISKFTTLNLQKVQEGQNAPSGTSTKATRSFFSLSAFRGSKPNETRHPYH